MSFSRFIHCPDCNNPLIIIDKEIISCPYCEVLENNHLQRISC